MALNGLDNPDFNNFTPAPSASHRLPTVSAAAAIRGSKEGHALCGEILTGLEDLDLQLHGLPSGASSLSPQYWGQRNTGPSGGLPRRQITEFFGPPGAGKTALALEACKNVLSNGQRAIWIDCGSSIPLPRIQSILSQKTLSPPGPALPSSPPTPTQDRPHPNFHHFHAPSLAHLIALLFLPSPVSPFLSASDPPAILVLDSLSLLFLHPSQTPQKSDRPIAAFKTPRSKGAHDAGNWLASRPWTIHGDFVTKLNRLAAVTGAAVLVCNHSLLRTMGDGGTGAVLQSGLRTDLWEKGVSGKVAVFRDWGDGVTRAERAKKEKENNDNGQVKARFACVLKCAGMKMPQTRAMARAVAFEIRKSGVCPLMIASIDFPGHKPADLATRKRKFGGIDEMMEDDSDMLKLEDQESAEHSLQRRRQLIPSSSFPFDDMVEKEYENARDEEAEDSEGDEEYRRSAVESALAMSDDYGSYADHEGGYDPDTFM